MSARLPLSTSARTRGVWSSTCSRGIASSPRPSDRRGASGGRRAHELPVVEAHRRDLRDRPDRRRPGRDRPAQRRGDGARARDARGVRALLRRATGSARTTSTRSPPARSATPPTARCSSTAAPRGQRPERSRSSPTRTRRASATWPRSTRSTLTDGVVLEIGGGSIQLIEVADRRAKTLRSFPLGAVRLTEQFLARVRPGQEEGPPAAARARARDAVGAPGARRRRATGIVGIGGAVRNLAAAAQRMADQPDIGVQGFVITREMLADAGPDAGGAAASTSAARCPGSRSGAATSSSPRRS